MTDRPDLVYANSLADANRKVLLHIFEAGLNGDDNSIVEVDPGLCDDRRHVNYFVTFGSGQDLLIYLKLKHEIDPDTFDPALWRDILGFQPDPIEA